MVPTLLHCADACANPSSQCIAVDGAEPDTEPDAHYTAKPCAVTNANTCADGSTGVIMVANTERGADCCADVDRADRAAHTRRSADACAQPDTNTTANTTDHHSKRDTVSITRADTHTHHSAIVYTAHPSCDICTYCCADIDTNTRADDCRRVRNRRADSQAEFDSERNSECMADSAAELGAYAVTNKDADIHSDVSSELLAHEGWYIVRWMHLLGSVQHCWRADSWSNLQG